MVKWRWAETMKREKRISFFPVCSFIIGVKAFVVPRRVRETHHFQSNCLNLQIKKSRSGPSR